MAIAVTNDASAFKRSANAPTQTALSIWGWFNFTSVTPARFWGPLGLYAGSDGTPTGSSLYQISSASSGSANLSLFYPNSSTGVSVPLFTASANTWYFIAITASARTAGTVQAHVRAITANTLTTVSNGSTADTFTPARMEWGRDSFTGDFISGSMHALGAANRAMSVDELLELSYFHEPQLDGISLLNVFYPCIADTAANCQVDKSGNARNATATPGALAEPPALLWRVAAPNYVLPATAGSGAMTGAVALTITPTGTLTGAGALVGSVPLTITPVGALTGAGALIGSIPLTLTPSGVMTGIGAMSGAVALALTPTGTLTGAGALAGSVPMSFTPVGALTGAGALSGSVAITFTPAGTLADGSAGSGAMSGSVPLTLALVGTLSGAGALAGVTALAISITGALTDASAPPAPTGQTPAGGSRTRRTRRYTIRIDGQIFEADSEQGATAIIERAAALAQVAANKRANEIVERALPKAISLGAVKPIAIKAPTVDVSAEIQAAAIAAQEKIDRAYSQASAAAEMRLLMALAEMEQDEEEEMWLMLH